MKGQFDSYFYLRGKFYKRLKIDRHENQMMAWDWEARKVVGLTLSDVRQNKTKAYSIHEAAEILNRTVRHIRACIGKGKIKGAFRTYSIQNRPGYKGRYYVGEDDILAWHEFFLTQNTGPARADGTKAKPRNLPTKAEVLAKLAKTEMIYVKNKQGEFVPVWSEDAYR